MNACEGPVGRWGGGQEFRDVYVCADPSGQAAARCRPGGTCTLADLTPRPSLLCNIKNRM